jgi:hypothetical protein
MSEIRSRPFASALRQGPLWESCGGEVISLRFDSGYFFAINSVNPGPTIVA